MVLLAIGLDSDPAMKHFLHYCRANAVDIDFLNLRRVALEGEWDIGIQNSVATVSTAGRHWNLLEYQAVYARPINLSSYQSDDRLRRRWVGLIESVTTWLQTAPVLVVNRPRAGAHNSAKPLHGALLARAGFRIPDSLTSSDPRLIKAFLSRHAGVVKAISGGRGDTQVFTDDTAHAFSRANGPIHLEQLIHGSDVRIHVVGSCAIAAKITSVAIDYRTADARARFSEWNLPAEILNDTIRATAALGLSFAGWDFKLDSAGTYWCLEVNPQPGYNLYDRHLDGGISRMLVELLLASA